jgi:hypothetical protein
MLLVTGIPDKTVIEILSLPANPSAISRWYFCACIAGFVLADLNNSLCLLSEHNDETYNIFIINP